MDNKNYNIKKAALFSIGYGLFASVMTLFAKFAAPHTTNSMIVLFRFGLSLIYIAIILSIRHLQRKPVKLTTNSFGLHTLRASSSYLGQFALFYSVSLIPLVDANLLFMTNALIVPILSAIFLGVAPSRRNLIPIIIGFIGIVFILKPGHEMFNAGSLIALSSGLFAAISLLGIHELGKRDHAYTIMFYYFSISFVIALAVAIFNWQTPDKQALLLLFAVGGVSTLCQECSIRALILAPAKIVAPLMYSAIVFSGLLDWIFWKNIPDLISIFGAFLICGSSILIVGRSKAIK